MRRLLWVIGYMLLADAAFLSYFWVFRHGYYFPDRYEDAFSATVIALAIAAPLLIAFVVLLAVSMYKSHRTKIL
jgi:hypothetical protein